MYVVTVEFEIKPEKLVEFRAQMIANATASREKEPGCLQFDVCADPAKLEIRQLAHPSAWRARRR